jgi:Mor family transcriptional regulator
MNNKQPIGFVVVLGTTWNGKSIYLTRNQDSSQMIGDAKVYKTEAGAKKSYPELATIPVYDEPRKVGNAALVGV